MNPSYYSQIRLDLLPLIDRTYQHAIEFGCGEGLTLKYLQERRYVETTYGVEIHPHSVNVALNNLDHLWREDVNNFTIPLKIKFNLVLLPDILEHLVNPWVFLNNLHKFITQDSDIIVSLPNVQHFTILQNLLIGDWQYQDSGIMDRTHLHYFTLKSAQKMFQDTGYKIVKIKHNGGYLPKWKGLLNYVLQDRIRPWFISQWLFKIKSTTL